MKKNNIEELLRTEEEFNAVLRKNAVVNTNDIFYEIWDKDKERTWSLNVRFTSMGDACYVLDAMIDKAKNSSDHTVSVYDFLALSGVFDDHEEITKQLKWTFSDITAGCSIARDKTGYYIDFPKTITLDAFN